MLDPLLHPELYDGILFKRVVAYLIGVAILMALGAAGFIATSILGVLTLGLAFALPWL